MRLPTSQQKVVEPPPRNGGASAKRVSGKSAAGSGHARTVKAAAVTESEPQPAAPAPATVDYTRPTDSTELLLDLQRRVIALEEAAHRKLTALEYAIVLEATTGRSAEQWKKDGYVLETCPCTNLRCKGWRMVPLEHHRTAAPVREKDTSPVRPEELKDVVPAASMTDPTHKELPSLTEEDHQRTFKQMLKQGLLTQKGETTLIPKDGPITWTHEQQLAFAHSFEMDELLELQGKPRELQRRLITALREIGYNILSAPEKTT